MIGANALLETLGLRKRCSEVLSVDCIDFTPSITPVVENSLSLLIWNHLCEMHNGSQWLEEALEQVDLNSVCPCPMVVWSSSRVLRHPNLNMSDTSPKVQYRLCSILPIWPCAAIRTPCVASVHVLTLNCSGRMVWITCVRLKLGVPKDPEHWSFNVIYSILGCNVGSPICYTYHLRMDPMVYENPLAGDFGIGWLLGEPH